MSYIQNRIGFREDVRNFLSRKTGLLCAEASLPTSSIATGEVRDNFMGIPQEFAHTRLYTDIDFTFYVDSNYLNLRIFEAWMDYISGGSEGDEISELNENYYRRMRYPDNYKVQTMFISKFERDFNSQIDYQFINAFPKLVTAIPVSYGAADLLKVTVSFTYDRYIVNPKGAIKKANSSGFSDIALNANSTLDPRKTVQKSALEGLYNIGDVNLETLNTNFFSGESIPFETNYNLGIAEEYNFGGDINFRMPSGLSESSTPPQQSVPEPTPVRPETAAPATTPEQQRGLEAAATESTRTGYVDPYRQARLAAEAQKVNTSGTRPSGAYGGGSDIRIKENIIKIGKSLSGLNIYEWNYKSAPNSRYQGVMAQEVIQVFPEAVYAEEDGFLSVYYDMIDVDMKLVSK